MKEIFLDSAAGKKISPQSLEQAVPSNKSSQSQPSEKMSFREVLKNATNKTEASSEIRQDIVNKYKISLANGTYEVKSQELAEKMIQKIRENKIRGKI